MNLSSTVIRAGQQQLSVDAERIPSLIKGNHLENDCG